MKKITLGSLILSACTLMCVLLINACSKGGSTPTPPADPCAGKTIVVTATVTDAGTGTSNGSIVAAATGSTGFTYSINNGTFQASGTFPGLAAGAYNVAAKDGAGCTTTKSFTVATIDACVGKNITVTGAVVNTDKCGPTGNITITAGGSTGFTYSLNNGAFGATNIFSNLAAGDYTLNAKDAGGCVKSAIVTIGNVAAGVTFDPVKSLIQTTCAVSGCHTGAAAQSALNFSDDCTIVSNWERIKARAVDANPSQMPPAPNPALSNADKQLILDWIAAGHKYTD